MFIVKKAAMLCLGIVMISNIGFAGPSLTKEIQSQIRSFDGTVGIYAKNLKTGKDLEYNDDKVFPTASTSKLVVAMATYKYLYPKARLEQKARYDEDVKYMMTVSDNPSFYELLDEIEEKKPDALQKVVKDLRLRSTQIHSKNAFNTYQYHSVTTPREMGKIYETIHKEKYLGKEKSSFMKYNLTNSIFNEEIPRYMLVPVPHKVGQLDDIMADVGVVDDGRDQILISVFTKSKRNEAYVSDFIADISAKLYNELRRK
jgi:beta-lactamase class A